jgi:4-amino-4-deoxy-L-arabinose transferase-like glycosyltransferase
MRSRLSINKLLKNDSLKFLLIILIIALVIRVVFTLGLVSCESQDDGLYLNYAYQLSKNYFSFPRYLLNETYANPAMIPQTRIGMILPTAIFFKLFGVNDRTATLFPLISSLLTIIVFYVFCDKILDNKKMGLTAALILAFFPLNVIYSTRIMTESSLILFTSLSFLLFFLGNKEKKNLYYFLSGLSLGIAYTITEFALTCFVFIMIYWIALDRKHIKKLFILLLGFIVIFGIESLYFYYNTGNPFYASIIVKKAHLQKMEVELNLNKPQSSFGPINFFYPNGYDFLFHTKKMFDFYSFSREIVRYVFFYFFVLISSFYIILFRKKQEYFLILWLIVFYLILEFGPTDVFLDFKNAKLNYFFIFKEYNISEKSENILTLPSILILSYFICNIKSRGMKYILLSFLIITFLIAIQKNYSFIRDGIDDVKKLIEFLNHSPPKAIYTDYITINLINYYFGFNYNEQLINFYNIPVKDVRNGYVVVDGSRGCDISGNWFSSLTPESLRNATTQWKLVKKIEGKITPYRESELKVYEIL